MPSHSRIDRRWRAGLVPRCINAFVRGGVRLCVLVGLFFSVGPGCRSLCCSRTSDEALAATRRLSLQGLEARQQGQWDQAEALFAAAIAQCPGDERARCGYAQSLWQRGARDEAITHMEEAVRLSGNDPDRMVELGGMYLVRGELHRAAQQAGKAIAINGELPEAWALRGQVLQAQGRRPEALASFHRALSYRAQMPEVQLAIAEIYRQQDRPLRALATLQALAASYPAGQAPVELLVREGLTLRDLGRHQDAARTLAQATRQGNPSADLFCELARTHLMAGDASAARQALQAALERDPSHAASVAMQAELATRQGVVAAAMGGRSATMH